MSKIRKMLLHSLHVLIFLLLYGILGAVIRAEFGFAFSLSKPLLDKTGWSELSLAIVISGLDLVVLYLLRRLASPLSGTSLSLRKIETRRDLTNSTTAGLREG